MTGWLAVRVCRPYCEINCGVKESTAVVYLFIYLHELLALESEVQGSGKHCSAVYSCEHGGTKQREREHKTKAPDFYAANEGRAICPVQGEIGPI